MDVDKRTVLIVVALTSFLTPFNGSSFNIALPSIAAEYSLDAIAMSWASLAYLLASAMFLIPFGKIADMYGRKRVFVYGISCFTVASVLLMVFPSSLNLILFRALQGVGSSMIFGTSMAILLSVCSPEERGSMLGATVAAVYIGLSVGPYIGGFLTKNYGWRSIFVANIFIGVTIVVLTLTRIKQEWRMEDVKSFDLLGSGLFSVTLLALMYGMSKLPAVSAYLPIGIGVVLLLAFVYLEGRIDNPIIDLNLFKTNKVYTFSNIAALINFSATFSLTFLLSMYLQYLKGLDPQQSGLIMMASPIVQAVVSPIAGRLSDRREPSRIASVGMGVTAVALAPLVFIAVETPVIYVVVCLGVLGLGLALFGSPNTNAIMSSVDRSQLGLASSTLGTMRLTGQMLSQGIAMTLIAVNLGASAIVPDVYPELLTSIRSTFGVFFVLCLLGIGASLIRNVDTKKRCR